MGIQREKISHYGVSEALASRNTDGTGASIDTQDCNALGFLVHSDARAANTFNVKIQESNDASTWTDADSKFVFLNSGTYGANGVNVSTAGVQKLAYIGDKRYARLSIDVTGSPRVSAVALKDILRYSPDNA